MSTVPDWLRALQMTLTTNELVSEVNVSLLSDSNTQHGDLRIETVDQRIIFLSWAANFSLVRVLLDDLVFEGVKVDHSLPFLEALIQARFTVEKKRKLLVRSKRAVVTVADEMYVSDWTKDRV